MDSQSAAACFLQHRAKPWRFNNRKPFMNQTQCFFRLCRSCTEFGSHRSPICVNQALVDHYCATLEGQSRIDGWMDGSFVSMMRFFRGLLINHYLIQMCWTKERNKTCRIPALEDWFCTLDDQFSERFRNKMYRPCINFPLLSQLVVTFYFVLIYHIKSQENPLMFEFWTWKFEKGFRTVSTFSRHSKSFRSWTN